MSQAAPNFNALANRYQVSARSIYRWHSAGINVANEIELSAYLCSLANPSTEALLALETILTEKSHD